MCSKETKMSIVYRVVLLIEQRKKQLILDSNVQFLNARKTSVIKVTNLVENRIASISD